MSDVHYTSQTKNSGADAGVYNTQVNKTYRNRVVSISRNPKSINKEAAKHIVEQEGRNCLISQVKLVNLKKEFCALYKIEYRGHLNRPVNQEEINEADRKFDEINKNNIELSLNLLRKLSNFKEKDEKLDVVTEADINEPGNSEPGKRLEAPVISEKFDQKKFLVCQENIIKLSGVLSNENFEFLLKATRDNPARVFGLLSREHICISNKYLTSIRIKFSNSFQVKPSSHEMLRWSSEADPMRICQKFIENLI
ncbi:MAG: hypothetical protein ABJO09_09645 [Hyphomicrobiales bacterium]|uniref:hypothetical protein n=1 Tax=Pseudomonadati TaxID=3379134 RepID=UPI00326364C3